jgi:protein-L-isoaspartate(D-aspartate) O-methyltransferase
MLARSAAAAILMTVACGLPQGQAPPQGTDWEAQRRAMVEHQLRQRGIASERVLDAMRRVPRHRFVPEAVRSES